MDFVALKLMMIGGTNVRYVIYLGAGFSFFCLLPFFLFGLIVSSLVGTLVFGGWNGVFDHQASPYWRLRSVSDSSPKRLYPWAGGGFDMSVVGHTFLEPIYIRSSDWTEVWGIALGIETELWLKRMLTRLESWRKEFRELENLKLRDFSSRRFGERRGVHEFGSCRLWTLRWERERKISTIEVLGAECVAYVP